MGNDNQATGEPLRAPAVTTVALLIAALCSIYVVSQFLRNSVGVIAPDLAAELDLAPQALGMLSSAFFLAFAAAQVPLGVAIDRYGPKTCMLASIGLAVLGCAVFALAESVTGLTLGRILMGLGCSSFLMGPLAIYTRWFRPEQFSTLTGMMLGIGTIGTLFATAPLAVSAAVYGWRTTFLFVGAGAAVVGLLVLAIVRDDPPGVVRRADRSAGLLASIRGLVDVLKVRGFWPLFAMHFLSYSSFAAILGLWGGPFLTDVLGFDLADRGNALFGMAAGHVVGSFVWGPSDRLINGRRLPVTAGVFATAAMILALCFLGDRGGYLIYAIFILLGVTAAYVPVQMAHGRSLFDARLVGRGITMLNLGTMSGVFVMQLVTGAIIGAFAPVVGPDGTPVRPLIAYQSAFVFLVAALLLAWLYYRTAPDPSVGEPADR